MMRVEASHLNRVGCPSPVLVSDRDFVGYGAKKGRGVYRREWGVLLTVVARPETAHLLVIGAVHEHLVLQVKGRRGRLHLYNAQTNYVGSTMGGNPQVELLCERVVRRNGARHGYTRDGSL